MTLYEAADDREAIGCFIFSDILKLSGPNFAVFSPFLSQFSLFLGFISIFLHKNLHLKKLFSNFDAVIKEINSLRESNSFFSSKIYVFIDCRF